MVISRTVNLWEISELQIGWQVCEVTTLYRGEHEGFRCGTVEWLGWGFADGDRVLIEESDIKDYFIRQAQETGDPEGWDIEEIPERLTRIACIRIPDGEAFYWYNASFRRIYPD